MNNDLMLVSRELLKRLYVYAEMPADEFGEIAALLAAPAAQAVDEDSTRIEKALRSIASIPGDSVHYHATHMSRIARAALADPVPTAREAEALAAEKALGIERLPAESVAPVQSEQEPVGWQFICHDGRWRNGDDSIKNHRANTEAAGYQTRDVYAAPVRAVRLPDDQPQQLARLHGLLELAIEVLKNVDDLDYTGEGLVADIERELDAAAQLNAQPVGPES